MNIENPYQFFLLEFFLLPSSSGICSPPGVGLQEDVAVVFLRARKCPGAVVLQELQAAPSWRHLWYGAAAAGASRAAENLWAEHAASLWRSEGREGIHVKGPKRSQFLPSFLIWRMFGSACFFLLRKGSFIILENSKTGIHKFPGMKDATSPFPPFFSCWVQCPTAEAIL